MSFLPPKIQLRVDIVRNLPNETNFLEIREVYYSYDTDQFQPWEYEFGGKVFASVQHGIFKLKLSNQNML